MYTLIIVLILTVRFNQYDEYIDERYLRTHRVLYTTIMQNKNKFKVQLIDDEICKPNFDEKKQYHVQVVSFMKLEAKYNCPVVKRVS